MSRMVGRFVPSQKGGTNLLDENNYRYRINKKGSPGTKDYYNCVKRNIVKCPATAVFETSSSEIVKIVNEHNHAPDIIGDVARKMEVQLINAAANIGTVSTNKMLTQVKVNLERSELPEAKAMMSKSRAISMALYREKRRRLGITGAIPKTCADVMKRMPEHFKKTSTGGDFLRFMGYVDAAETKMLLLFISDHGKWVLERSEELYCDGTFHTCPKPFLQVLIFKL
jgi:FLYWCH zinc finger domain